MLTVDNNRLSPCRLCSLSLTDLLRLLVMRKAAVFPDAYPELGTPQRSSFSRTSSKNLSVKLLLATIRKIRWPGMDNVFTISTRLKSSNRFTMFSRSFERRETLLRNSWCHYGHRQLIWLLNDVLPRSQHAGNECFGHFDRYLPV